MRLTIRMQFFIGLLLVFSLSLLLLNTFTGHFIDTSNERTIAADLLSLNENAGVYVKQTFMIHHFSQDETYYREMAPQLVDELQRVTASDIAAYTLAGELLEASDRKKFEAAGKDDLKRALDGETAYTLSYSDRAALAYYAYPVVVDGNTVGILRFVKDFSYLYEQGKRLKDVINMAAMSILGAAFLFSYWLSRNISVPIEKLTEASTAVTNGNLDVRVSFRRKDELGKLADNFNRMNGKIRGQIEQMEQDRDRLAELNRHRKRFYDNVTHELKTPITSILGYAQMIRRNGRDDEVFFEKGMTHIEEESRRLHDMVVKLLEQSGEGGDRESFDPLDLSPVLRDVCEGMTFKAARYKKKIRCRIETSLLVKGSAHRLRQLLINLIDNAINYGYPHSEIIVTARIAGSHLRMSVANEGEPMSTDMLGTVFEHSPQAEPSDIRVRGSRGLGLSICKSIADEHGGTIGIVSANGETRVTVTLPCLQPERRQPG
ncbi:HAMP domain-containing sensor histidine kinase [Paenibacillus hodogayensis]|uniref:histidine kinase n=1 Tax=Paenibacillus hodogayensis TaxID=279208 RepID=A0ABV5W2B1_9BACL